MSFLARMPLIQQEITTIFAIEGCASGSKRKYKTAISNWQAGEIAV